MRVLALMALYQSPIHKINEEWVWFCLCITDMMGVASGLSVVRGRFQWNFSIGIMPTVRCPESRSVRSWEAPYTLAL